MLNPNHALVVLSGGQDSTTCLFWALKNYEKVSAITFNYGQSHDIELKAAAVVVALAEREAGYDIDHEYVVLPGVLKSASPLTNGGANLAKYENFQKMEEEVGDKIEKTFVPMRNTFFLTLAANRAVAVGAGVLVTGVCQGDNANYPDCTENFIKLLELSFNQSLGLYNATDIEDDKVGEIRQVNVGIFGCENGLHIATPLMHLSKAETARMALDMDNGCWEALAYSHTSYDGKYPPTDNNHSNLLRAEGFLQADLLDPLVVRAWFEGLMELPETSNYDPVRDLANRSEEFDPQSSLKLEDFLRPVM